MLLLHLVVAVRGGGGGGFYGRQRVDGDGGVRLIVGALRDEGGAVCGGDDFWSQIERRRVGAVPDRQRDAEVLVEGELCGERERR